MKTFDEALTAFDEENNGGDKLEGSWLSKYNNVADEATQSERLARFMAVVAVKAGVWTGDHDTPKVMRFGTSMFLAGLVVGMEMEKADV